MALTVDVTKTWPTYSDNGLFSVGVEVVLNDDDVTDRKVNASEQKQRVFTQTTSKTGDVEAVSAQIVEQVQNWIDAYVIEKNARKHAKYESLRSTVAGGLNLTE